MVPVVEPEILIDGSHTIVQSREVTERVLSSCVAQLWRQGVSLEGCLIKPQMCVPGADAKGPRPSPEEVAMHTLSAMQRCANGCLKYETTV